MYDLISFYMNKIQKLLDKASEQEEKIAKLETYIFELCDKDCPKEYKQIVKKDVFEL